MSADFVHLHVHSQYSMLDSTLRLKKLVGRAKDVAAGAVLICALFAVVMAGLIFLPYV